MLWAWPPVGLGLDDPQIHLGPAGEDKDLLRTVGENLVGERSFCEVVGERCRVFARRDDVEVTYGLLHAAQGTPDLRPLRRRVRADEREYPLAHGARLVEEHPALGRVVGAGGVHHLLRALLTEAFERGDLLGLQGRQLLDVRDA